MKKTVTHWVAYATAHKVLVGGAAAAIIVIGWFFFGGSSNGSVQTITVAPQLFLEQVSASGKVIPAQEVDLGFSSGGRVSRAYVRVGDTVRSGAVLAEVENADLRADVLEAQALVSQRQAQLADLKAGAQPEDVAASQAALDKAKQDLVNLYGSVSDVSADAYAKADDAVRVELSPLFSNAEGDPRLTYATSNTQAGLDAQNQRGTASIHLNTWQSSLIQADGSQAAAEGLLSQSLTYLSQIRQLLSTLGRTLENAPGLSADTLASYKAAIAAGVGDVTAATKNLNTVSQNIASQKLTVVQAQAELNLKKAGATQGDIAAQEASVAQAQAQLQSAQARLMKTLIVAPFSGTVTTVDAKAGMTVAANTPQISLNSSGTFQIESYVPEVNIAQINVGDDASVTLDAYGVSVPFSARVVSIDPAETIRNGISTYRILLEFTQADSRIKSGMTATLAVTTNKVENSLVVPIGALIEDGSTTKLKVRRHGSIETVDVVVGARGIAQAQILSGLMSGEEVVLNP